jgi:hypothetical protein
VFTISLKKSVYKILQEFHDSFKDFDEVGDNRIQRINCSVLSSVYVHCKKRLSFFPSPAGMHLPNFPWPGIINLFPSRESLVCDIPAGDGKIIALFYSVVNDMGSQWLFRFAQF